MNGIDVRERTDTPEMDRWRVVSRSVGNPLEITHRSTVSKKRFTDPMVQVISNRDRTFGTEYPNDPSV